MSWTKAILGDHVDLLAGYAFKSADFIEDASQHKLLRGDNIAQGNTRWDGAKYWPTEKAEGLSRYELRKNDVVLAMDRPWIEAGLKHAAIRENDLPALLVQRVARLRTRPHLDQVYLRYVIGSKAFTEHVKAITTGVNVPHISARDIQAFTFLLPPFEAQRRIADVLSAYDDLIEVNTLRIAILEDMARRLFEEWFVRRRFPESSLQSDSLSGGWSEGVFGDLVSLRRDKTKPGDHLSSRRYVPIECIGKRTLYLPESRRWEEAQSSLQTFEKGDVLFGAMRAYFHKVCVAPFAGITRSTCFVLTPRMPMYRAFATLLAFRDDTVAYAAAHSKGSTIPYAQWDGSLEKMPVVIPSDELLSRFEGVVSPMLDWLVAMHDTQANLRATRDFLLPKLITGEIEVRAAEKALEAATA